MAADLAVPGECTMLGYVVVTWPQDGGPEVDKVGLWLDRADAASERDRLARETAAAGRGDRHAVAAVVEMIEGWYWGMPARKDRGDA